MAKKTPTADEVDKRFEVGKSYTAEEVAEFFNVPVEVIKKGGILRFSPEKKWKHTGRLRPSTSRPHTPQPYARIGAENKCQTCGDIIE